MAMSREKVFAAQFLAVTMFLLFLPGVSRSDTYLRKDSDADAWLLRSPASEHPSDHAFKFDDDDKRHVFKFDDDDKAEKSGHRTGKIEHVGFQAGSTEASDPDGGDGDGGDAGVTNPVGSLTKVSLTAIPDAPAAVTSVPEPAVLPLLLLGGLLLTVRRLIPIVGRLGHWLSTPMGGQKLIAESRDLETASR